MKKILPKIILGSLSVLCTVITLTQFFLGISTFSDFYDKILTKLTEYISLTHLYIVATIFLVGLVAIYEVLKYDKEGKKAKEAGHNIHYFHHKVRDEVYSMRQLANKASTMDHIEFYRTAKKTCSDLCNYIVCFLHNKLGKDFSVCIKMIDERSINPDTPVDDVRVYTFCRAGKERESREQREKNLIAPATDHLYVRVGDNTDFLSILSTEGEYKNTNAFACSNLRMVNRINKILKKPEYQNTTEQYWKYYKSTVVVPIRIESQYLQKNASGDFYQTVAFLCVDHKKTISKAVKDELAEYINGFADAFYTLFHEISIIDRAIAMQESLKQTT